MASTQRRIKCIYCLNVKPKLDFNREHVIPEALGKFQNNLVLHETVCSDCNKYFGDNLEIILNRDTAEGVYRYKFGIKPKEEPTHRRISFRIAERGELEGVHVRPIPETRGGNVSIEPLPQVGFLKKETGKYVYFKSDEIPEKRTLIDMGFDLKEIQMLVPHDRELPALLKRLEEKGLKTEMKGELEWPESVKTGSKVAILGDLRIDRPIFRAICKIAFNYLALVLGREFVLRDEFDGIRNYIRHNNGDTKRFFSTDPRPILYEEARLGVSVTQGHIIVAEWQGIRLVGMLRLFNMFTYVITYCRHYSGIWFPFASGHHFDPESKMVTELGKASKRLIPI